MREQSNASGVAELGISMMGFIFYPPSPRYVGEQTPSTDAGILRVGVFVNSDVEYILDMAHTHSLDYIQLHGGESVEMCRQIKSHGLGVIKAISISCVLDISAAEIYVGEVDYLLFDTKCPDYGGSGERFDWSILNSYSGETKFMLSGGIDEHSASQVRSLIHPQFAGVDLNSRFEDSPACKNIEKLRNFIANINS